MICCSRLQVISPPSTFFYLAFICVCWLLFENQTLFEYQLYTRTSIKRWLGNMLFAPTLFDQGEVGISATIIFEALTGERASSHLELHNEGGTAIFYSWQQLPVPHSFPNQRSQTKSPHFYFDSSSGTHTCCHHSHHVTHCLSQCQPTIPCLSTSAQPAFLLSILLPLPSKV